jgi:iron complex transport system ATP-binding protein
VSLAVHSMGVRKGSANLLRDVSFTAPGGAVTGLIGPNGAGKSTLLKALLGLETASGDAPFESHDLLAMPRRDRARLAAYVEQSSATEERLSVRDVVALGRIPFEATWQAAPSQADLAIIEAALAESDMTGFADRRFSTLSGGEQQRVQVARALAQQPRLLVLDEPTSHLDIRAQLQLLLLLRRKAAGGMTILLAIHDLNLAARFCDHLVLLRDGAVAAEGAPRQVLTEARLRDIYGVEARILPPDDAGRTTIVFDRAVPSNPD